MSLKPSLGLVAAAAAVLAVAAGVLTAPSPAATTTKCPSGGTPAPGSTINGNLEVDGQCFLDSVTVKGSAFVDPQVGWLFGSTSTITKGISVGAGAELDLDLNLLFAPGPIVPGSGSSVGGNVVLDHPRDVDIEGAVISGSVTATAPGRHPTFCGNTLSGFSLSGYSTDPGTGNLLVGDPAAAIGEDCSGNTIGTLSISNSSSIEVEGNAVGLGTLNGSAVELNSDTIGHLRCSKGATIVAPDSGEDTAGNVVLTPSNCW